MAEGWDYICLTDGHLTQSTNSIWTTVKVPESMDITCPKRRACYLSMQFYRYIDLKYDSYILLDGSYKITSRFPSIQIDRGFDMIVGKHPDRDCIYREAEEIIRLKKDEKLAVKEHIKILENMGYPKKNGLCETGVIVINNITKAIPFLDFWYSTYTSLPSKRDQLSFNYCLDEFKEKINVLIKSANPPQRRPFQEYFSLSSHK